MASTPRWSQYLSSFWLLQGAGWGAYGLLWFLASLPIYHGVDASLLVGATRTLYYVALGIGLTLAVRPLYRRLWARGVPFGVLLTLSAVYSLLGSGVWLLFFEAVKWPLDAPSFSGAYRASSLWYFARPVVSNTIVLLAWSVLYFGIKYQHDLLAQQEQTLRAETLAREAQLQMLRYQLNPHFLFNLLNTLLSMIGEDDRRAKQFVQELAEFLRYSLLDSDVRAVPLREEIDALRSFLAIEKLRFEEDLQLEIDVDPDTESVQVPPFLVQPLVENALKHGRRTGPSPLRVCLSTTRDAETLLIDVANTGRLRPLPDDAPGIGLSNVQERLHRLYPDRHHFTLREDDGWVRAQIAIESPELHSGH